ncbi:hypothetical protein CDD82_3319 [Ophiocordyceps australis]|uniref:C2H2-type domain-containing protein n=1 Tax=Ophiocordyceps australis TaxID=1399860 RepID=A0A2C5ZUM5_9HYPO|nr:hypothetical protein CDD82_3319 [Ophiocordyceps australis]
MISLLPQSDRYSIAALHHHYNFATYPQDQKYSAPALYPPAPDSLPDSPLSFIDPPNSQLDLPAAKQEDLGHAVTGAPPEGKTLRKPESMQMQPDAWSASSSGRYSHKRDLSSSTQASAGPASPASACSTFPQIVTTDSSRSSIDDIHSPDDYYHHQLGPKPMPSWPGYHNGLDGSLHGMAYPVAAPAVHKKQMLPAQSMGGRPHTESAHEASCTPRFGMSSNNKRSALANINVPKLDRTMTDVYGDELYSPNFAITSTSPSQSHLAPSPVSNQGGHARHASENDVFSQRISAANNQHLSVAHTPLSRNRSPFRTGSPLAPVPVVHDSQAAFCAAFASSQRIGEQEATHDEGLVDFGNMDSETPKTMSPQDAVLEFSDPDADSAIPLFSPGPSFTGTLDTLHSTKNVPSDAGGNSDMGIQSASLAPAISMSSHMTPDYRDAGDANHPILDNGQVSALDSPPLLSSSGSSSRESRSKTPVRSSAPRPYEGGTYTCTYHGCTMRFETPWLLQKHKREGHRQPQGLVPNSRDVSAAVVFNTQAGPHRCDRINPSTGKSCNTVFSRPYDLTRHEDTIHNARKQKVRCDLCSEDKTFSRADALTRHYRVCHPDVALPGKHRRRGGL